MRTDIELNVVPLNLNLTTNAKALLDKVAAQIQEADSWKRLDFKLLRRGLARVSLFTSLRSPR